MKYDLNGFKVASLPDDHKKSGVLKSLCGLGAILQLSVELPTTECRIRFHRKAIFLFKQIKNDITFFKACREAKKSLIFFSQAVLLLR